MTPSDHYFAAERLLVAADEFRPANDSNRLDLANKIARAQAHATLALVGGVVADEVYARDYRR